jgi:hypothetical protein
VSPVDPSHKQRGSWVQDVYDEDSLIQKIHHMNIRLGREAELAQWLPLWQGDQTFGKTAIADKSGFVQYRKLT